MIVGHFLYVLICVLMTSLSYRYDYINNFKGHDMIYDLIQI